MKKDSEMTYEEKLKEELELVRCDLHNAYSWLNAQEQENRRLKKQIDKIKEYIEENVACMNEGNLLVQLNVNELLEILKGDSNE